MDVSVIIVNYNTASLCVDCIESLNRHSKSVSFEIIVVDNCSTDNSAEILRGLKGIVYIQSERNLGFGKANNLAMCYANGRYVFLLNSDTIILNDVLKLFVDAMEKLPDDVACIGGQLLSRDGMSYTHSFGRFTTFGSIVSDKIMRLRSMLGGENRKNVSFPTEADSDVMFVDYIIGADIFIRKSIVDKLGLFDSVFFMYYEESDMQYRYLSEGYKSCIIKGPRIIHYESNIGSEKRVNYSCVNRYLFYEGEFFYMRKRYNAFIYLLYRLFFLATTSQVIVHSRGGWGDRLRLLLLFLGFPTLKH